MDSLVDDLGRHGGSKDDGSLLVAGLGPEVGGGLSTCELSPDVDVVCGLAQILGLIGGYGGYDKDKGQGRNREGLIDIRQTPFSQHPPAPPTYLPLSSERNVKADSQTLE